MKTSSIYRTAAGLTRWPLALPALLSVAGGCSLPVSMPLTSFADAGDSGVVTGSITPAVEESGMSARVGDAAWPVVRAAIMRAIEAGEDGETFPWRHHGSGTAGTVTPVAAYFGSEGEMCRRLAMTASGTSKIDVFTAEACLGGDGRWHVSSGDAAA